MQPVVNFLIFERAYTSGCSVFHTCIPLAVAVVYFILSSGCNFHKTSGVQCSDAKWLFLVGQLGQITAQK